MLTAFIQQHCLTKTGKLNNRTSLKSWWVNKSFLSIYDQILQQTNWLPDTTEMPERLYCIVHNLSSSPLCQVCTTQPAMFSSYARGYLRVCSRTCTNRDPERSRRIAQNHDYVAATQKARHTNQQRYGVSWTTQSSTMKQKSRDTKLQRYGSSTYTNLQQAQQTNQQRYGVLWTTQSPHIKEKMEATKTRRRPELRNPEWLRQQNTTKSITQIAQELGVTYRAVYLRFQHYQIPMTFFRPTYNQQQRELVDFIQSLGVDRIVINDRTQIAPKELDLYLPEYQLAIEYNGLYWHSEDPQRHLEKHELCRAKNIRLIQIWDSEWLTKRPIVESILRSVLHKNQSIYARTCIIRPLSSEEYRHFLEHHHLQGSVASSIRYGLFHKQQLVSVIGCGSSRFNRNYDYELHRFCTHTDYTIVGGFSKLFKHVIQTHSIRSLISYCDRRIFTGMVYAHNGFSHLHTTPPGYFYHKNGVIQSRHTFQKHKLAAILDQFDPNLSEHENCTKHGWLRVWDCGQDVFVYNAK